MSGSALAFLMASNRHRVSPRARAAGRSEESTSREGSAHDRVSLQQKSDDDVAPTSAWNRDTGSTQEGAQPAGIKPRR